MSRRSLRLALAAAATLAVAAAAPLSAQDSTSTDSVRRGGTLAPVVTTAPRVDDDLVARVRRGIATRVEIDALARENRALERTLARQGKQIDSLEARLNHLKTTVTDSVNRQIAEYDAARTLTRSARQRLEAKIAAMEAEDAARAARAKRISEDTQVARESQKVVSTETMDAPAAVQADQTTRGAAAQPVSAASSSVRQSGAAPRR